MGEGQSLPHQFEQRGERGRGIAGLRRGGGEMRWQGAHPRHQREDGGGICCWASASIWASVLSLIALEKVAIDVPPTCRVNGEEWALATLAEPLASRARARVTARHMHRDIGERAVDEELLPRPLERRWASLGGDRVGRGEDRRMVDESKKACW